MKKASIMALIAVITFGISNQVQGKNAYSISRITGRNRYETSANISNKFSSDKLQNVIIANGNNFPDALSGSTLSKKLNAPILLISNTISGSSSSINYIKEHLVQGGTIYALGGNVSINNSFSDYFKSLGYDMKRLGGNNRFDTNKEIVNFMKVDKGTPVFLVNGYGFADALSISSVAAAKGYPIIMSHKEDLPNEINEILKEIQPSKIFIIGGEAAISSSLENELKLNSSIERVNGNNRYETSLNVCKYFSLNSEQAIIANGENFPDALSGSAIATKFNAPIILTDGSNIIEQKRYLDSTKYSNLIILGGKNSVSVAAEDILSGKEKMLFFINKGYIKDGKKYIEGYFDKFVTDLDEARAYEGESGKFIIAHDETGDWIPDGGFDMPISNTTTLQVDDNVKITQIHFDAENNYELLYVDKDFNSIIVGKYEDWPYFDLTLRDGKVIEMYQQYRP